MLLLVTVVLIVLRRLLMHVIVDGHSMSPALFEGDRALCLRFPPARVSLGSLVVVRTPEGSGSPAREVIYRPDPTTGALMKMWPSHPRYVVKRVVGLPGQRVAVGDFLSGRSGESPYEEGSQLRLSHRSYWIEGEADFSVDSKVWGPVDRSRILGVVIWRIPASRGGAAARSSSEQQAAASA